MGKGKRNRARRNPNPKATLKEAISNLKALKSNHEGKVKSLTKKIEVKEAELKEMT